MALSIPCWNMRSLKRRIVLSKHDLYGIHYFKVAHELTFRKSLRSCLLNIKTKIQDEKLSCFPRLFTRLLVCHSRIFTQNIRHAFTGGLPSATRLLCPFFVLISSMTTNLTMVYYNLPLETVKWSWRLWYIHLMINTVLMWHIQS